MVVDKGGLKLDSQQFIIETERTTLHSTFDKCQVSSYFIMKHCIPC